MTIDKEIALIREQSYINGEWRNASSGQSYAVKNPYNGEVLAHVPDCNEADADIAIVAAHEAFASWSQTTAKERSDLLRAWHALMLKHQEELALLLTLEQGKPLREAQGEVLYGASYVQWFAEETLRINGDTLPGKNSGQRIMVIKQPVGVVAAITPWNFPIAMITRKIAPALGAGCTAVIKPAEDTPLSALALADLAHQAGFPKGVLNIITSNTPKAVGKALTQSKLVKKISFTGSTPVGKILMEQSASTLKRLSMELGGNAPFIVFDDADIDKAVQGAIASKFRNSGQTCVCANRIFVQSGVYEEFVEKFTAAVSQLSVGAGINNCDIAPLINKQAIDKVTHLVSDAIQKGANVYHGGQPHELGGTFFEPTVLGGISEDMDISTAEIFGPVAPIFSFEEDDELIERANATDSGLAAYFFTQTISRIWKVAESLEYGMVGINSGMLSNVSAPFGGVKESGFGREGSKYGIEEYLQLKYLCWEM